jgi:Zn-dependent membrane protease YugP
MAIVIIGAVLFLALAILPTLWVKAVLAHYSGDRPDFPGTGGEFARHVLDGMGLGHVKVEETKDGDHYDPSAKTVRLAPQRFNGRSLTAVVVAAHEVGHAMQHATGWSALERRTQIAKLSLTIEAIGAIAIMMAPIVAVVLHHPVGLLLELLGGLAILGISVALHVVTLPVEFDASFNRAMTVLTQGRYIPTADLAAARHILWAAAFTYVAGALVSLINVMRWMRVLRF